MRILTLLLCSLPLTACCGTSRTSAGPSVPQPAPIIVQPRPPLCRTPGPRPLPPESLGSLSFGEAMREMGLYVVRAEQWGEAAEQYVRCMERS